MSIKQNGVLIAGGGQGGGQAVVNMDNITITNNANHEIQTVAKINQNQASGAVGYLYDWCGTLEEYNNQDIANSHPDWICYITNDNSGSLSDKSIFWVEYGATSFSDIKTEMDDGKLICCKYNNKIYSSTVYITGETEYIYLSCVDASNHTSLMKVSSLEAWTIENQTNQAAITGAATTILTNDLTQNKVLVSNTNGKVDISQVTTTELDNISGTTSNVQTQLDNKVAKGYELIAEQTPTSSNNWEWYRKYANGWVEQGWFSTAPGTYTLPVTMNGILYGITATPLGTGDNASVHAHIISASQIEVDNENGWNMCIEVKGIAA